MKKLKRLCLLLAVAIVAPILAGCAGSTVYVSPNLTLPTMPSHITACPSVVQLKSWIKQIEAQTTEAERKTLTRQAMAAIRTSELRNNRCLVQALAYYQKIVRQRQAQ